MVTDIINFLVSMIEKIGYPGVFLSMFIESFFAPIPSELILPFAGFLASKGTMNIYILAGISAIASYLGTLPFYFIGSAGKNWVEKFLNKYGKYLFIKEGEVALAFNAFEKYGNSLVLVGRMIPIVRSLISFPAGVIRMNFVTFSIFTLIGSLLWSFILAYAGFLLGENWAVVEDYINKYQLVVIAMGVVAVIAFIVWKVRKPKDLN